MGTLTKVFALLVSVVAIFLCGVVVTFVTNTENWKDKYQEQKTIAEAARVQAMVAEEAMSRSAGRHEMLIQSLKNNILALEQQNSDLLRRWSAESQNKAEAQNKAATAVQVIKSLRDTIQNMYTAEQVLNGKLHTAQQEMITAQTQAIELTRELNSERVKSAQLNSKLRQWLEKTHELEDENAELRQKLQVVTLSPSEMRAAGDQVALVAPSKAGVPIRGQITDLDDDLASISIGSASGVRKNMKFLVYRGSRYLGDLVITHVESSESAGQLVRKQGVIVKGDNVSTGFD